MSDLDFRTNKDQSYKSFAGECRTVRFMGICPVCGKRIYSDGTNDPRGALGFHAADWLVASEYGMIGNDVLICWECNNDAGRYQRALKIAMGQWK